MATAENRGSACSTASMLTPYSSAAPAAAISVLGSPAARQRHGVETEYLAAPPRHCSFAYSDRIRRRGNGERRELQDPRRGVAGDLHSEIVVGVDHERIACGLVLDDARLSRRHTPRANHASRCGLRRCSTTPRTLGWKRTVFASWKLDTSTAIAPPAGTDATASTSGRPMFPAATDSIPPAPSIAARRLVVVVLPLVPVTARNSHFATRKASSTSLQISTPPDTTALTTGALGGDPRADDRKICVEPRVVVPSNFDLGPQLGAAWPHAPGSPDRRQPPSLEPWHRRQQRLRRRETTRPETYDKDPAPGEGGHLTPPLDRKSA